MRVCHELDKVSELVASSAVAIGNFDGLHLGHHRLLESMLADAKARRLVPTVLTFYPHPVEVLMPGRRLERLTTTSEKLALLESAGVELVLVAPFDLKLAQLSPDAFFTAYLEKGLKAASVHVGFNFRFGKDRAGDKDTLAELCRSRNIALHLLGSIESDEGLRISSSSIRELIRNGEVKKAARLLGRPFTISGQVMRGEQRGRALGFPTANIRYPTEKVLPKNGVYVTRAIWQHQGFTSVTNIGVRPTFAGSTVTAPVLEVHFIDFAARIYDEFLQLEFLDRVRDEKKFDSREALIEQIRADVELARTYKIEE